MLTSKSGNEITIASKAAHDGIDGGNAWNGGEPVSSWDFQIQMVDSSSTGDNGLPTQIYGAQDGKYSKRRWSNVAAIIVRIVFIRSFLFQCLLLIAFKQTQTRLLTALNFSSLLQLTITFAQCVRLFLIFEQT